MSRNHRTTHAGKCDCDAHLNKSAMVSRPDTANMRTMPIPVTFHTTCKPGRNGALLKKLTYHLSDIEIPSFQN